MAKWGLPTLVRAVPAYLLQRVAKRGSCGRRGSWPNEVLLLQESPAPVAGLGTLIAQLPPSLRETALTHSSWTQVRTASYERLEFLGDSVLGLVVAATLYELYPASAEGELARLKAFAVSRASCALVAEQLGVGSMLSQRAAQMQVSTQGILQNRSVLGNVLEALIGAVFLAHGFEATRQAVAKAFEGQIRHAATALTDYKTVLQEYLAARGGRPSYHMVLEEGPPHAKLFTSEVEVDGQVRGRGVATTIKLSEQLAAREALISLGVLEAGEDS